MVTLCCDLKSFALFHAGGAVYKAVTALWWPKELFDVSVKRTRWLVFRVSFWNCVIWVSETHLCLARKKNQCLLFLSVNKHVNGWESLFWCIAHINHRCIDTFLFASVVQYRIMIQTCLFASSLSWDSVLIFCVWSLHVLTMLQGFSLGTLVSSSTPRTHLGGWW